VTGRTIRLDLAYDGTGFRGWARQRDPAIRTIEGEIVGALARVLGDEPRLSVAGRTDAGVHARGQVASFATEADIDPTRLRAAVNRRLAPEIVVLRAGRVADRFDARFSALAREYRYVILTGALPDPFTARYSWHHPRALALLPMRTAASRLVGSHDFRSFCRSPGADRSTVRDLHRLTVSRRGDTVSLRFGANAFLHQMVRSIVGTLVAVGEGKLAPQAMTEILEARDRARAGPLAPPQGLTLEGVIYPRGLVAGFRSID
jgi:tRNA pseudouridine38-40 synthase